MPTLPPVTADRNGAAPVLPRPLRVLLIEDSVDDALLLRRHLSKAGFTPELYRVETSESMRAALAEPWDCILADYNLPLFSAPEALRLLQGTGADIPFIMMSGAVSEATAVAAMRAGAHDYVSKENLTRLGPAIERELAEAASRRVKRATERALRSSEERFHRLVEATPLALLICDTEGQVSYSNRGAQRLLGYEAAGFEGGGVPLAPIFSLEDFGTRPENVSPERQVVWGLQQRMDSHKEETWEATCLRADGTPIPVLIGAALLNPEAPREDAQLAIFFVDLSEQKQGEEVLRRTEKLAAAGRLAASIAHEINNPLEAITNCLYLLEQGTLDEESRSYLLMAQRELDRVTHITTQTLRFYRQSTGPTRTDIADLMESVLVLYEARIRDHGIEVVRECADAPTIIALEGEIRQVLANLIGNAVDAMMGGPEPRRLVLRAHPCRSGSGVPSLAIVVADRGSGMSPATLRRIFEPFFSTKGITGTGLGLWVSREIITKHSAQIQVRSRQGVGTVFRLVFPLVSTPDNQPYETSLPVLN